MLIDSHCHLDASEFDADRDAVVAASQLAGVGAIVVPAIATVGVLLLRGRAAGPPLAVVALVKIVTLFVAVWAGALVALFTEDPVELGPDAGPSALLLVVSSVLVLTWLRTFPRPPTPPTPSTPSDPATTATPRRLP